MTRGSAQAIGRTVLTPWQLRRCVGFWLPEEQYVIRDGSNRVSYVESLVPKARRVPLVQATSTLRPSWTAAYAPLGARPVLDLDQSAGAQWMAADAIATAFGGVNAPATFIAAIDVQTGPSVSRHLFGATGSVSADRYRLRFSTSDVLETARTDASGKSVQSGTQPLSPMIVESVFDGSSVTLYRDGTLIATGALDLVDSLSFDTFLLGALSPTSSQGLQGQIGAAAIYSGALSSSERHIARSWMQRRFDL